MKYLSIALLITAGLFAGTTLIADAHSAEGAVETDEQNKVTEAEFEEMQDIMLKMMNGEQLTDAEAEEMNEFMADHHGGYAPMGMMHSHAGFDQSSNVNNSSGMIGGWGMMGTGGTVPWFGMVAGTVWLLVGLLLIALLTKKIMSDK